MVHAKCARAAILMFLIGALALVACSTPAPPTTGTSVTVTGVAPASGSVGGGTSITITGTGFAVGATVDLRHDADVHAATGVAITSSTTLTATVPAHAAGALDVVVTNPGGPRGSVTCTGTISAGPPQTISGTFTSPTDEAVGGTSGSCDFS